MRNFLSDINVLVVGASVGGLTVARCLQRVGMKVRVVERLKNWDEKLRNDTGVCIFPEGQKVLQNLGLADEIKKTFKEAAHTYRNANGEILSGKTFEEIKEEKNLQNMFVCKHSNLLKILCDENLHQQIPLPVHFDSEVVSIDGFGDNGIVDISNRKIKNEKMKIEFANEDVDYADLLIAADGTHSSVRRIVAPSTRRVGFAYSGFRTISGIIKNEWEEESEDNQSNVQAVQEFIHDDSKVVIFPLEGGDLHFTFTYREAKENARQSEDKTFIKMNENIQNILLEKFKHFDIRKPSIEDVLHASLQEQIYICSEYNFEEGESLLYKSRIAFIGQAAQTVPPACLYSTTKSIVDGWELSVCLSDLTNEKKMDEILQNISLKKQNEMTFSEKYFKSIPSKKKNHLLDTQSCLHKYMEKRTADNDAARALSRRILWLSTEKANTLRKLSMFLPLGMRSLIFRMFGYSAFKSISCPPPHFVLLP